MRGYLDYKHFVTNQRSSFVICSTNDLQISELQNALNNSAPHVLFFLFSTNVTIKTRINLTRSQLLHIICVADSEMSSSDSQATCQINRPVKVMVSHFVYGGENF